MTSVPQAVDLADSLAVPQAVTNEDGAEKINATNDTNYN